MALLLYFLSDKAIILEAASLSINCLGAFWSKFAYCLYFQKKKKKNILCFKNIFQIHERAIHPNHHNNIMPIGNMSSFVTYTYFINQYTHTHTYIYLYIYIHKYSFPLVKRKHNGKHWGISIIWTSVTLLSVSYLAQYYRLVLLRHIGNALCRRAGRNWCSECFLPSLRNLSENRLTSCLSFHGLPWLLTPCSSLTFTDLDPAGKPEWMWCEIWGAEGA